MKVNIIQSLKEPNEIVDACISYLMDNYNNLTCAVSVLSWSKADIIKLVVQVYNVSGVEYTFTWYVPTQINESIPLDIDDIISSFRSYVDIAAYNIKHRKEQNNE